MLAGLIGALVVGPMYMKGPTGQPIMTAKDWVPAGLEAPTNLTAEAPSNFYSWVDEEGVAHFSDAKPAHLADDQIETYDAGVTMTLPSEAFTGPKLEDVAGANLPEPLRVLLRSQGGGAGKTTDSGVPIPAGTEGQAAMNGALAEIAERFPQFMAMSDEMANKLSQPSDK